MTSIQSVRQADSDHLTHTTYRADIDGLRAIAVLSVVGFHAFPLSVKGGFIGVDVFFVISGFLISTIIFSSLERKSFSFIEFYSRRIKRIFPALLLVLVASFTIGWFVLLADEYKQLGKHIAGGAGFISNFMFWNESGYFDNAAETKPLLHLWSLGIEEQFYIFWPLLLWITWTMRLNLLTITVLIAAISFALNLDKTGSDAVAVFYSPQTRFWELLVGSVLAYMTLHEHIIFSKFTQKLDAWLGVIVYANPPEANGRTLNNIQSVLGAALIITGVFIISKEMRFPGWWAVLPIAGAVLIISAGAQAWLNRVVLSSRVLVWFGLISFPLYLWHWPLLSFTRIVKGEIASAEIRIAVVLVSILLAWLTYRLVEKPVRLGKHGKEKIITLLVLMLAVGNVGYYCYKFDGLVSRFPKIVQDIITYKVPVESIHKAQRFDTCFLDAAKQDYTLFNACESPSDKDKKTLLLWGDSHAAHLYTGYKASFGEGFNIIQRTAGTCPPILDMEIDGIPYCKGINDSIFELIKLKKPSKIVLAASWISYDWKKLEATVAQLRKLGIVDIDLIGPVPRWIDTLPKQLYLYYKSDKEHRMPERMKFGLESNFIELDPILANFANQQLKVNYISPTKILCNDDGCLTRLGETGDMLTAFDAAHLTETGSRYLVSHFQK